MALIRESYNEFECAVRPVLPTLAQGFSSTVEGRYRCPFALLSGSTGAVSDFVFGVLGLGFAVAFEFR